MNKHRIVLNIAILMIASTFLHVSAQPAYPSAQIVETNNFGINRLPSFAPGVVLIGLKPGIVAGVGVRSVETTSLSLNKGNYLPPARRWTG